MQNESSLHCELASSASEDFVGDCHFLDSSPVVLMSPNVSPSQEEDHWNLRDCEPPDEGLLSHHWHEEVDGQTRCEPVLKASQLVLGYPVL